MIAEQSLTLLGEPMPTNLLRHLPSVTELLDSPPLQAVRDRVSHNTVVTRVRGYLEDLRTQVQTTARDVVLPSVSDLAQRIAQRILLEDQPHLRPVINATGVLLPEELGRAPLADAAIEELGAVARGYCSPATDADVEVQRLLTELAGAEAALVVNNQAGATLLALAAIAAGREVVISRGQVIDAGDAFRLPEIAKASGALLREAGTTNRTLLEDYRAAANDRTAAILMVHADNFAMSGFTSQPSLEDIGRLGRELQVPVIQLASNATFVRLPKLGIEAAIAAESLQAGVDVVILSGDTLPGGPSCGILLGRRTLMAQIDHHPLMRCQRVDKLTLAALAGTLRLYRQPDAALDQVPLLQLLTTSVDNLRNRAERLAPQLGAAPCIGAAEAIVESSRLTEHSPPSQQVPTWCVALTPAAGWTVETLGKALRGGQPPIIARPEKDRLLIDLRTTFPRQDAQLVEAVTAVKGP